MSVNKASAQERRKTALPGAVIYLFMSAFEHNSKGAVANQILPAELKLPDSLHDQGNENRHYSFQMSLYKRKMPRDISLSARTTMSHVHTVKRLI